MQNGEIPCPFCKTFNSGPEDKSKLKGWITSLVSDEEIVAKVKLHSKHQVDETENCSPCKAQDKSNKGSKFCALCHETMCETCSRIHNAWKIMKDHKLLDLPKTGSHRRDKVDIVQTIGKYLICPNHPDRLIEFQCQDHDVLICATCVAAGHRKCISVVEINESISTETAKKDASKLKDEIRALSTYAEDIIKAKRANIAALKNQSETIGETVREFRAKLLQLFEGLEEDINHQTKAITKKHTLASEEMIATVKNVSGNLKTILTLIENAINDSPSNELYIIVNRVRKTVLTDEETIVKVSKQSKSFHIRLEQQGILEDMLALNINEPENLAKVEETEIAASLSPYKEISVTRFGTVKNAIKVHIQGNYPGSDDPIFSDILFLQNDLLIVDSYKCHSIFVDNNHNVVSCQSFDSGPTRATDMKTGIVALCKVDTKRICFISADRNMNVISELPTKYIATALYRLSDGGLAIAWDKPVAFGIIQPYGSTAIEKIYFTKDKADRKLKSFEYMAVDLKRGHVIQPRTADKTVYCFDLEGNPQFSYASDYLKYPRGVAVDKFGNVFICDSSTSSIHVITSRGGPVQIITTGCPKDPLAIALNSDFDQFAVTNGNDDWCEVTIFTLSHEL